MRRRRPRAQALRSPRSSTYGASSKPLSTTTANHEPLSLACRWGPAQGQPLEDRDRRVERDPEQAGEEDAGPRGCELERARPVEDQDAERVEGAAEVLADDGADHRQHRRDLQ